MVPFDGGGSKKLICWRKIIIKINNLQNWPNVKNFFTNLSQFQENFLKN